MNFHKIVRYFSFLVPPMYGKIKSRIYAKILPRLEREFHTLNLSNQTLRKLIQDYEFNTVLDVGSGSGNHAKVLNQYKKKVTALDFGTSIYAKQKGQNYNKIQCIEVDFFKYKTKEKYDCIWASHVLEHQSDPGAFIRKCKELVKKMALLR